MCISYNFPVSQNIILSLTFSQPLKNLFLADAPYTNRGRPALAHGLGFLTPALLYPGMRKPQVIAFWVSQVNFRHMTLDYSIHR